MFAPINLGHTLRYKPVYATDIIAKKIFSLQNNHKTYFLYARNVNIVDENIIGEPKMQNNV